jgi:outer membrane protein assembly factor BamB
MPNHRLVISLCCLGLLILTGGCTEKQTPPVAATNLTSTPLPPPRQIMSSTLALELHWQIQIPGEAKAYRSVPGLIFAAGKKLVLPLQGPTQDDVSLNGLLTSYSLEDGQLRWETPFETDYGSLVNDAIYDRERNELYLLYSFRIGKFDIESGKQLWESQELGSRATYYFASDLVNPIVVRSSMQELITIDPDRGEVVYRAKDNEPWISFYPNNLRLSYSDQNLWCFERATNRELWVYNQMHIQIRPLLLGKEMLIQYFSPISYIALLNAYTGQQIWAKGEFISNYAVSNKTLYVLQQTGDLISLDINNGDELGRITFSSNFTMVGEQPYWVTVITPYVILYFGDTHELLVFKEKP